MRAGRTIRQIEGYRAFIPEPLPPKAPPLEFDHEVVALVSEADRSLARLDGVGSILPSTDLFVGMYVRHEAVLSSQIEGTQSTLEDILQIEADGSGAAMPRDVEEVVNYVRALNGGLARPFRPPTFAALHPGDSRDALLELFRDQITITTVVTKEALT